MRPLTALGKDGALQLTVCAAVAVAVFCGLSLYSRAPEQRSRELEIHRKLQAISAGRSLLRSTAPGTEPVCRSEARGLEVAQKRLNELAQRNHANLQGFKALPSVPLPGGHITAEVVSFEVTGPEAALEGFLADAARARTSVFPSQIRFRRLPSGLAGLSVEGRLLCHSASIGL